MSARCHAGEEENGYPQGSTRAGRAEKRRVSTKPDLCLGGEINVRNGLGKVRSD